MPMPIPQFFERLADMFAQEDLSRISDHFTYPLPFFAESGLLVFGAATSLQEALKLYYDATQEAGIVRLIPRVIAHGVPVRGYSNVWVEWDHVDTHGDLKRTSQVRYAVYQPKDAMLPRLELVDYTVTAFPELHPDLPLCRSA